VLKCFKGKGLMGFIILMGMVIGLGGGYTSSFSGRFPSNHFSFPLLSLTSFYYIPLTTDRTSKTMIYPCMLAYRTVK
jgi:hypothetical protein